MRKLSRYVLRILVALSHCGNAQYGNNGADGLNSTDTGISTTAVSQATSDSSPVPLVTPTWGNGTCLSRTANYITHTLPQKCLRTDRGASITTKSTGVHESGHTAVNSFNVTVSTSKSAHGEASATINNPSATDSTIPSATDAEPDSPLDNANFLSFEEWKRQNQFKAEQAAEQGNLPFGGDRQRPGINNALDSLGDEGEIELDFSGFGSGASGPRQQQAAYRAAGGTASEQPAPASHTPRSKDAGKTCKERTNYASFDCAATVLKNNPECKSASSVLVENKDSYMLNICSAKNKFFIVELCNDILVDTVVLANFEFFSSIFRHFRLSVSDRYPVKIDKWRDLGTFEARNTREVQAFLIEHPQIWARYLRIEFVTHYGSEYYCPVSLLRVHGTTMLEEIRPQEDVSPGENAEEVVTPETEATAVQAVPQEPSSSTDEIENATVQAMPAVEDVHAETSATSATQGGSNSTIENLATDEPSTPSIDSLTWTVNVTGVLTSVAIPVATETTCASPTTSLSSDVSLKGSTDSSYYEEAQGTAQIGEAPVSKPSNNADQDKTAKDTEPAADAAESTSMPTKRSDLMMRSEPVIIRSTTSSTPLASGVSSANTPEADSKQSEHTTVAGSSSTDATRSTSTAVSSVAAQPLPQPSTQESFFKSIHKRLQQLEANSTLSLQYIEEQSRILRDAFTKVEKRQISATTSFLTNLNASVMVELHGFRQAYDQLWQSTVIELEGQREQYQREMLALSSRLTLVADELVWQKRMGIVQSTLLLLCLGLVLFARTGQAGYLEVPLLQQMRNKSYTALNRRAQGWESPVESPSPESRSPVALLRRKLLWRSFTEPSVGTDSRPESKDGPPSEEMIMDAHVKVEPPTPESGIGGVLTPGTEDEGEGVFDMREVASSPSTPTGTRNTEPSWGEGEMGVT